GKNLHHAFSRYAVAVCDPHEVIDSTPFGNRHGVVQESTDGETHLVDGLFPPVLLADPVNHDHELLVCFLSGRLLSRLPGPFRSQRGSSRLMGVGLSSTP